MTSFVLMNPNNKICDPSMPSYYTAVPAYLDWITSAVESSANSQDEPARHDYKTTQKGSRMKSWSIYFLLMKIAILFFGSSDKTIRVWDVNDYSCKKVLGGHNGGVYSLCV